MNHTNDFLIHVAFGDNAAMPLMVDYTKREGEEPEWSASIVYVVPDDRGKYKRDAQGRRMTDCVDVCDLLTDTQRRLIESEIAADIRRYEEDGPEYEPDDTRAASGTERYMAACRAKREAR